MVGAVVLSGVLATQVGGGVLAAAEYHGTSSVSFGPTVTGLAARVVHPNIAIGVRGSLSYLVDHVTTSEIGDTFDYWRHQLFVDAGLAVQFSTGRFWMAPWIGGRLGASIRDGEACRSSMPCEPYDSTDGIIGPAGGLGLGVDVTTLAGRPFGVFVEATAVPSGEYVALALGVVLR